MAAQLGCEYGLQKYVHLRTQWIHAARGAYGLVDTAMSLYTRFLSGESYFVRSDAMPCLCNSL